MPDFTPLNQINRQRALAQSLQQQPLRRGSNLSGLAHLVRQFASGKAEGQAREAETANQQIRSEEMQALLQSLGQGGLQGPPEQGQSQVAQQFQSPEIQDLQAKAQMQQLQAQQRQAGQQGFGTSPLFTRGPGGEIGVGQMGQAGGFRPTEFPEGVSPILPGAQAGFDPASIATRGGAETLQDVANIQATAAPEAAAAGQRQQAVGDIQTQQQIEQQRQLNGIALDQQQAVFDQERAQELEASRTASRNRISSKESQNSMLNGLIDQAIGEADLFTTGLVGSIAEHIPGTPAYDLTANLDTIRANIGFDKLAEMRANSPTGGALGQVSDRENRLLQAVWGSLENSQSRAQFVDNLELVKSQVAQSWDRINEAYMADFGEPYFQSPTQSTGRFQIEVVQ